jgi:hypothetical protein
MARRCSRSVAAWAGLMFDHVRTAARMTTHWKQLLAWVGLYALLAGCCGLCRTDA